MSPPLASTTCLVCWMSFALWTAAAYAQLPSFERAVSLAKKATVTVRVTSVADQSEEGRAGEPQVTVFSGVVVGSHLIVTPLLTQDAAAIRVTLPGGAQATARAAVLDEYSGLALLEADGPELTPLALASQLPEAGTWVISAAGWGVESPAIAFGMISAVDRRLAGTTYPPLLQCNITVSETSSGAPVLDAAGRLVGIVVAAEAPQLVRGWSFAVPASHVARLLRVYAQRQPRGQADRVVVLKRRRPVVGMEIGGELDRVVVRRVAAGGPAARAGIQVGDRILAVDGVQIRSPYQAVQPTLFKQPGDTVTFLVERDGQQKLIEVVLGGGVALPAAGLQVSSLFQPKITVGADRLAGPGSDPHAAKAGSPGSDQQELERLRRTIERYETLIAVQQSQIARQQRQLDAAESRLQHLEAELQRLKQLLTSSQPATTSARPAAGATRKALQAAEPPSNSNPP